MRTKLLCFLALYSSACFAQFKLLPSGTTVNLTYLSVIKNNIMIYGEPQYLVKSYDGCEHLQTLQCPSPGYPNYIRRTDTAHVFSLVYNPASPITFSGVFFSSKNGAKTWAAMHHFSTGQSCVPDYIVPLDSLIIYLSCAQKKSVDGGNNWITISQLPLNYDGSIYKFWGDSVFGVLNYKSISLTKNKGSSWTSSGIDATNLCFLSKDSLLAVSNNSLHISSNFGQSYISRSSPVPNAFNLCFKHSGEGYVIGSDENGQGLIAKTTDLGNTWVTVRTGINKFLMNMEFLDDSLALLTGQGGLIMKWNYKATVFSTGISEKSAPGQGLSVYPIPTAGNLHIATGSNTPFLDLTITNSLSETVLQKTRFDTSQELDVSGLPNGVYFLNAGSGRWAKLVKN